MIDFLLYFCCLRFLWFFYLHRYLGIWIGSFIWFLNQNLCLELLLLIFWSNFYFYNFSKIKKCCLFTQISQCTNIWTNNIFKFVFDCTVRYLGCWSWGILLDNICVVCFIADNYVLDVPIKLPSEQTDAVNQSAKDFIVQ